MLHTKSQTNKINENKNKKQPIENRWQSAGGASAHETI